MTVLSRTKAQVYRKNAKWNKMQPQGEVCEFPVSLSFAKAYPWLVWDVLLRL